MRESTKDNGRCKAVVCREPHKLCAICSPQPLACVSQERAASRCNNLTACNTVEIALFGNVRCRSICAGPRTYQGQRNHEDVGSEHNVLGWRVSVSRKEKGVEVGLRMCNCGAEFLPDLTSLNP